MKVEELIGCKLCNRKFVKKGKKIFCSDFCCDTYHSHNREIKTFHISRIKGEVWKDIQGFEGYYQISNFGRVKSCTRITSKGKRLSEQLLKGSVVDNDYLRVMLYKNSKYKACRVHSLVAKHFLSNNNDNLVVNHIDGDKLNNHADNLEYVTYTENLRHAYKNRLRCANHLYKHVRFSIDGEEYTFNKVEDAAIFLNVSSSSLINVLKGRVRNSKKVPKDAQYILPPTDTVERN